jgi:hypothetical protein
MPKFFAISLFICSQSSPESCCVCFSQRVWAEKKQDRPEMAGRGEAKSCMDEDVKFSHILCEFPAGEAIMLDR